MSQSYRSDLTDEQLDSLTNDQLVYPDYYQVPFHAYDKGNLCWQAAFEAASATYSMGLRLWKDEDLTWQDAQKRLRHSFYQILEEYTPTKITDILDLGCSVGISTRELHRYFSQKQDSPINTIGLDLSPYMLSVAKITDVQQEIFQWLHGLGESTSLANDSQDIVTLQFLIHELPRQATKEIFQEVLRILKPGGVMGVLDNNPASPVIQSLSPVLFTLMKSTEPWIDDYYTFDVETAMQEVGFDYKKTVVSNPRHRALIGIKPRIKHKSIIKNQSIIRKKAYRILLS